MRKLFLILMTLMACTWSIQAQTRTYHGTILDAADHEPLIGATIMPIGGGQGAAADLDGNFTVTVPSNVKKAKLSYVGYTSQEVTLEDGATYYLSSDSKVLDDVIVVAYGTATKESLTGSVAVVGSKEIEDRPVTTVTQALEGNAPGVQVNNSTGTPGSAPSIRIRGFNSINGDNSPLYVVDGIPLVSADQITQINPADIESMSILKDAASCALYGNRGANGVVLVTTKKAKNVGKIDVTLSVRQGLYTRGLPFYDRLNANEWMQAAFDAQVNGDVRYEMTYGGGYLNGSDINRVRNNQLNIWRGNFINTYALNNIYGVPDNELFDEAGKFVGGNPLPGYRDLDWWPAVSRQGYRQEYAINAAGATEKFNIFASVSYMKENGYMLGTDFERFTGRVNANFNPTSWFKFGLNLNANQQESEQGNVDASTLDAVNNPFTAMYFAPIFPYYAHNEDGSVILENGQPVWNTAGYLNATNVAWEMRLNQHNYSNTAIDGTLYGTAVLPYGFEFTLRGQIVRNKSVYVEYLNNTIGSQRGSGMLTNNFGDLHNHTFMQTLTWTHDYGKHHVDVLLDHENFELSSNNRYLTKMDQVLDGAIYLDNFQTLITALQGLGRNRAESYLGRVRYDYDGRYYGEASVRRDGSSKFAKQNRWGTFWSVGGSWVISREKWLVDNEKVNYLKLRAAYGSVGNDASAGSYSSYSTYSWNSFYNSSVIDVYPASLGVNNLKWESTKTLDVALEGSFFPGDRFNFTLGYFNKRNADLLFAYVLPLSYGENPSGGNSSIMQNVGEMENQGVELSLGVNIFNTPDFFWDFRFDATFIKNKVKKLPGGNDLPNQGLFIGKSLYQKMMATWVGVEQYSGQSMYEISRDGIEFISTNPDGSTYFNEEVFNTYVGQAQSDAEQGLSIFMEKDGKYYTSNANWASTQLQGSALPPVYGSFSTNLAWKGINLGILFTYSIGGKTYDTNYAQLMGIATSAPAALHKDILKSWTEAPAGVNGPSFEEGNFIDSKGIPQLNSYFNSDNNAYSSRFLIDSSYLCLKNINVSYDLPYKWVDAMRLQGINIGFTCDNVFLVTKRKGMNPQYGFSGGQGMYYVPSRVFSFQLNVRF